MADYRSVAGKDTERLTRLVWATYGYRPSNGLWPIHGLDDELVIESRGQQEIHDCKNRLILVSGGVRAGKSEWGAMEVIRNCFVDDGLIWIVGPDYEQADNEFSYVVKALGMAGMISSLSDPKGKSKSVTTSWGCVIQTKSSKEVRTIAGKAPHFLLGVEMGQQEEAAYNKLRERAIEHGAVVAMTGTFEGAEGWYPMLWDRWQGPNEEGGRSFSLPTWSNPIFSGRDDYRVKEYEVGTPVEVFMERCAAIPYKPQGLVHKAFNNKRHVARVPFDPKLPIEIAVDPATHTYAIEAIQWEKLTIEQHIIKALERGETVPELDSIPKAKLKEERTRIYVVDEVYEHDTIAQDIIPKVQVKEWFPYVTAGVIDQAGSTRNANKSQVEIWRDLTGVGFRWNYVYLEEQPPLLNLRLRVDPDMGLPLILFNWKLRNERTFAGKALGILGEMGLYQYPKWRSGRPTTDKPINANNDAIKAICYWLYEMFGPVVERRKQPVKVKVRNYGLIRGAR